jgi:hypothetical protein
VESTKRYAAHFREMTAEGAASDGLNLAAPNEAASVSLPDDFGYLWKQRAEQREIAGLVCTHWIGETASGDAIEAWGVKGTLPPVRMAMAQLRVMNDPMALVPVRTLVPGDVFPAFDALIRSGVTPLEITWGPGEDKNRFTLLDIRTRQAPADLFAVPKLYMKTTLITMDGILDQKK